MARPKILVADDEPLITALIRQALGSSYEILCVNDGADVLQLVVLQRRSNSNAVRAGLAPVLVS